ncbi:MAG TPA: hypothetical protein VL485_00055 [Ktedonobacteraceae bacterium]|jgi:hypothetical protein|nr:hypothetical protein [Ktedonobacteraceae bacterium]
MSENPTPGEIELLEKLALGLLIHPGDPRIAKPRLFLGKIPEHFPIDLPIPEQSRVMGTLARSETQVEIVMESDLTPEAIFSFYRTQLTSLGWHELENMWLHQTGGFIHSNFGPHTNTTFCQGSDGAGLTLSAVPLQNTTTSVRIDLSLDREANPCAQQERQAKMPRHIRHHDLFKIIPPLVPPQGAQQYGGGGGSGSDDVHTSATLKTNLALDVLPQHYADQLLKAGWTQIDAGISGPLAWHTWRFTSEDQEPWSALFFILKTPEKPNDYFLYIRTTWIKPESNANFTGWSSNAITFGTN